MRAKPDPAGLQCRAGAKLPLMPECVPSVPFVVMSQSYPSEASGFLKQNLWNFHHLTSPTPSSPPLSFPPPDMFWVFLGALTEILNKIYPKSNMSFPSFSLKYSTQKCRGLVCHFVPLNQGFRGSNGKASTESESVDD